MTPKELRQAILAARDALPAAERRAKSAAIAARLLARPEIKDSGHILLYVSFRSEVETWDLLHTLLAIGKKVSLPFTHVKAKYLDAIPITDPEKQLTPGYCDIPEPSAEARQSITPPEEIEAIILPGSVFDLRGGRFGYGGGFYDRYVVSARQAWRIGLAFDGQIVPEAPLQPHDQLLDLVITESRVIVGSRDRKAVVNL
ncbi:MAG: 5-formyltetrahydrofolate cyclo-ligase [Desulfobulbaceae bacterium]|jgi:5-formyltetrahydrofolate cyclo-ligase|nr:5-formyltetrahydrofolate cyclo-ligase [Desulfobulbaceae bacterium]